MIDSETDMKGRRANASDCLAVPVTDLDTILRELSARLAPKRYFTIAEAVAYSGQSRSTLYEAQKRGDLIFTKFGGATRIERVNLDAFLDATGQDIAA